MMDPMSIWKEYGLLGLMCGAVITLLFIVVKWTLATTRDIMKQASIERECWQKIVDRMNETWNNHISQARAFHDTVQEAHKYQREEHAVMMKGLTEITVTLGRINGYK
jgi:hypothetical protein